MCSIAGVTGNNSYQLVNAMLDLMLHRAPDDKGIFRDKDIVLGMGRLKIIDLASKGEKNPIQKFIKFYNWRHIYNFFILFKCLPPSNLVFKNISTNFRDKLFFVNLAPNAIILALLCCLDNLVDLIL